MVVGQNVWWYASWVPAFEQSQFWDPHAEQTLTRSRLVIFNAFDIVITDDLENEAENYEHLNLRRRELCLPDSLLLELIMSRHLLRTCTRILINSNKCDVCHQPECLCTPKQRRTTGGSSSLESGPRNPAKSTSYSRWNEAGVFQIQPKKVKR